MGDEPEIQVPRRSSVKKWILRSLLGLLLLGLAASWIAGGILCLPANHPVTAPKDLAVEPVNFKSASGSTIQAWLVEPPTNHGIVILQPGVYADRTSLVGRARFFSGLGYAVLMFDFQAEGESPGNAITFGYLESRDSAAAVAFVKARFPGKPIAIVGTSLGAAAAVLAKPPLDVQAMVLEMMYPTIVDATKDRLELRLGRPGRWLSPLLTAQFRLRVGCSADDLRPIDQVAKITVPKLFLAGTADRHTTLAEAQNLFAHAAEPKQFETFEGAGHVDLLAYDSKLYEQLTREFLATYLK